MEMRDYEYKYKDYSLLKPVFKKWMVSPLLKLVPNTLPANMVTLTSNGFVYFGLLLALQKHWLGAFNFLAIPFLFILYLISSQVGRMHAKHTATESPLGEFLCHFFDTLSYGGALITAFVLLEVTNAYLVAIVFTLFYLAQAAAWYDQFKSGWLIFEKIGSFELWTVIVVVIATAYLEPIGEIYTLTLVNGIRVVEAFFLAFSILGMVNFLKALGRVKSATYGFWLFCIMLVLVGYLSSLLFPFLTTGLVIILYAGIYIGKLMQGHLIDGVERSPGFFTPILLMVAVWLDFYPFDYSLVIGIYLIANVLYLVYKVFVPLKKHWFWVNPKPIHKKKQDIEA